MHMNFIFFFCGMMRKINKGLKSSNKKKQTNKITKKYKIKPTMYYLKLSPTLLFSFFPLSFLEDSKYWLLCTFSTTSLS